MGAFYTHIAPRKKPRRAWLGLVHVGPISLRIIAGNNSFAGAASLRPQNHLLAVRPDGARHRAAR
jgi:hypothetical protein